LGNRYKIIIFVKNLKKMKVLLDIQDYKAAFAMELLESLPFIKAYTLPTNFDAKSLIINDLEVNNFVVNLKDYTLDDVDTEQKFNGIDEKQFRALMSEIHLEDEPIDELLATIQA
jgi:hypothetical protein